MDLISRRSLLAGMAGAPAAASVLRAQRAEGAAAATPARLNVIEIVADTWSTHWVNFCGAEQAYTPNLNALAAKSYVFDDVYAEALPTIAARRSIYTGRRIFPGYKVKQVFDLDYRCWHPLYVEDVTMSEAIIGTGVYESCMISDNQHTFLPDKNFHRGFYGWRPIRGQEGDMWETGPRRDVKLVNYLHQTQYAEYSQPGMSKFLMTQYLVNKRYWQTDDDRPTAQVFTDARRWLDNNTKEGTPFYLHLETFSPHEFWDPPEDFYQAFMHTDYSGPRLIFPPYTTDKLTAAEMAHVCALYTGAVAFTDYHLGRLWAKMDELQLWDSTIVVFTADHGTMMGEQGQIHKGEGRMRTQETKVPLIIWDPRTQTAKRIKGFAQHTDIMPTVLDMMRIAIPDRVTGTSLWPYMQSGATIPRDMVVTGWENHGAMRTNEWLYQGRWNPGDGWEELYDVRKDPLELNNLNQQNPAMIEDYRKKLKEYMDSGWAITKGTFLQPEADDPNVPA